MNYPSGPLLSLTEAVGLNTDPIPTSLYTDPHHYELELEHVFRRAWLKVGRVEQLAEEGSFFVKDLDALDASIIITRTKGGRIRAFHNVCSHRGNQVELCKEGKKSRFTCLYHGWTYKNSGELIGVPDAGSFFNLDKEKCGLTPVGCDVWEGWIFINLQQPRPETTLEQFLGQWGEIMKGLPWPHADNYILMRCRVNANWKTVADAFSESYHVPTIHPKTLGPAYSGSENPYCQALDFNVYGPHRSMGVWGNMNYKAHKNAEVEKWLFGESQTVTGTQQEGRDNNPLKDHPGINPKRKSSWAQDTNWIFPNTHIQISANRFWSHEFWPTGQNSTLWESRFYLPRPSNVLERVQMEFVSSQIADAMLEDVANIESTQRGMRSGAKSFLNFQDGEAMLRHSLYQVQKWTAARTATEALS